MGDENFEILKYIPMKSFVHSTFWHKLAEIKIDVDKLCDAPKNIYGWYTNVNAKNCLIEVDYSAFNTHFTPSKLCLMAYGTLYNKNTIEEFKECDKMALLIQAGEKLLEDIKSGKILDDPRLLARFIILSFADLKVHQYYYWFAFPSVVEPMAHIVNESSSTFLKDLPEYIDAIENIYNNLIDDKAKSFFILKDLNSKNFKYHNLKDLISSVNIEKNFNNEDIEKLYFCFSDPSEYEKPSWFLRVFITAIFYLCPALHGKVIKVLSIRLESPQSLGHSLLLKIRIPSDIAVEKRFIGWEANANGKMGARCAEMANTMDPAKLAENSVNLNLKLMKWRLLPDLDLDIMANTKCLLFGAGTLGCAVARNLLAWGFKTLTFIDNGKVSYSNPVRQTLYKHEDAVSGHKMKATTAAERTKEINPNIISNGHILQIPMPGHTIGDSMRPSVLKDLKTIDEQIKSHDVLFLLTDSRESRWLPTLLGASYKKIVINAALGFDSYLVMRHGSRKDIDDTQIETVEGMHCIPGSELGCYFCNDVTAPGDSMRDRTLDQQCTVTRPGVSNIAGSYAVELLVSILQHKLKDLAPAYYSIAKTDINIPEGALGIIPHSIRGMLGTFENILPATSRFTSCIACSEKVLNEFGLRENDFLFDVFTSAKYLEDLTGISNLADCENDIIECSDSDLDLSD